MDYTEQQSIKTKKASRVQILRAELEKGHILTNADADLLTNGAGGNGSRELRRLVAQDAAIQVRERRSRQNKGRMVREYYYDEEYLAALREARRMMGK